MWSARWSIAIRMRRCYVYSIDVVVVWARYGSAGSGKSHVAAQKLLLRALEEHGHRIPSFRKVKDTVRRSTFQRFKDILSAEVGLKRAVRPYETTMDIRLAGSVIWNLGLDDDFHVAYFRGSGGLVDLYVYNKCWFGMLRSYQSHYYLETIYRKWIQNQRWHDWGFW